MAIGLGSVELVPIKVKGVYNSWLILALAHDQKELGPVNRTMYQISSIYLEEVLVQLVGLGIKVGI